MVIIGSPDPVMRNEIINFPKALRHYGGIHRRRQLQAGLRPHPHRAAVGIIRSMFFFPGSEPVNVYYPEKMIDPLKPLLILPEVTEESKWKRGKPWFIDPEEQYILMLFANVDSQLHQH